MRKGRKKRAASALNGRRHLAMPASLSRFRGAAITKLRQVAASCDDSEDDGLDHLYATTEALINLNSEIAQRCLVNYIGASSDDSEECSDDDSGSSETGTATSHEFSFFRIGFDEVKVQSTDTHPKIVKITTLSTRSENVFTLPALPDVLGDIIPITQQERSSDPRLLPDYQQILGQASLLHADVLVLVLVILKDHLKSVQTALGNIESWLLKPEHVTAFLNKRFKPNPLLSNDLTSHEERSDISSFRRNPFGTPTSRARGGVLLRDMPFTKGYIACTFQVTETSQQEALTKLLSFLLSSEEGTDNAKNNDDNS